jgi:hypothetical protein
VSTRVGLEREDFFEIGGDEGRHARLLLAHSRRPHRIAGHAGDTAILADEIERLHGLFGEQTIRSGGNIELHSFG